MGILFDSKDPKWSGMGHESCVHPLHIVENGEAFYLHAGESVIIEDIEVPHIRHDFRETSDDKALGPLDECHFRWHRP